VWCREVRAALSRRFAGRVLDAAPPPPVGYALRRRPGRWWLAVACGWCAGTPLAACIMCGGHYARLAEVVNLPLFRQLAEDVKDAASGPVLCDLVEEVLGERPEMPPPPAAPKWLRDLGPVVFEEEESGEAIAHAEAGGVAVHLWRRVHAEAPTALVQAVKDVYPIGHVYDRDANRLTNLARRLGVRSFVIDHAEKSTQHVTFCGVPLRKLLAAAGMDLEQLRR